MLSRRSEPSVALAKESMAETSSGQLDAADAGQVDGQAEQVGPARQGRERPGEGQREVELVGRLLVLGEQHDGVLEGEEDAGVDVEGEVEVERAAAALLGVQVDLPDLAQGVGLDEVPLVVHVEPVVDGVVLQVGDVPGDVDGSHSRGSLTAIGPAGRRRPAGVTTADRVRPRGRRSPARSARRRRRAPCVTRSTGSRTGGRAEASRASTASTWPPTARRCPSCTAPGLAVLSEESGVTGDGASGLLAVIDPVDGSTNAHRGVPFYSTSICVLDAEGPRVGLVVNQATGDALRRRARRRGREGRHGPSRRRGARTSELAIVGISGFPGHYPGWAQYRALGAASLECCAVAEGVLDAYLVVGAQHALRLGLPGRAAHLPRGGRGRGRARGPGPDRARRVDPAARSWRRRARWPTGCAEEGHCERRRTRRSALCGHARRGGPSSRCTAWCTSCPRRRRRTRDSASRGGPATSRRGRRPWAR